MNDNALLLMINTFLLLLIVVIVLLLAYCSARFYRDTYDFKKSARCYVILYFVITQLFLLLKVPVIIVGITGIFGFIITAMISNYYFYK